MIGLNDTFKGFLNKIMVGILVLTCTGCQLTTCQLNPVITCPVPACVVEKPSAFLPLTTNELTQDWAKELLIGDIFAREWDLYRAITSYKRALILLPMGNIDRCWQIHYNIILSYYLGNKHVEAIAAFEESPLTRATPQFPAFNELLLMIYDSYMQTKRESKAEAFLEKIQKFSAETGLDLAIYEDLTHARVCEAQAKIEQHPESFRMQADLDLYYQYMKSPSEARKLNAILPGAGYYYVGQKKAAMTSFLINTLFILASYECFKHGYPAAGLITASLETGWYVGGINGAGIAAQEFNNRLFEGVSTKILKEHTCFPILMFETSF